MGIMSIIKSKKTLITRVAAIVVIVGCLTALMAQTVFAKNTYVITDGDQVTVVSTFATDPAKVLNEAGFDLNAEDLYTTEALGTETGITVQRAMFVTVDNCGATQQVTSYGETVEALLTRSGISIHGDYRVSHPLDEQVTDGMTITVEHMVAAKETYTVEIPFETSYVNDPTLAKGAEKVLVEGNIGQMLCTADVVYINTREASRSVLEETVLEQPVGQIVAVGTGENVGAARTAPLIGNGFIVTTSGEVLTYTHSDTFKATAYSHLDEGCDMITATGTTVRTGTVAVDPTVIPYGTRMFIVANDGSYVYGLATAEDCGGGIKGNHVDLYFDNKYDCFQFGIRNCTIYFLGDVEWNYWAKR